MEASRAVVILQCLAGGVDPNTDEVYSEDSPYQKPQTIRALFLAVKALERYEKSSKSGSAHCPKMLARHGHLPKIPYSANASMQA